MRNALVVLTLVSHLLAAFGYPLVGAARPTKDVSTPFPCQDLPCGCRTAELCWQGDCCCFTLEEKLQWANTHGIQAPAHVRPVVEARKACCEPARKSCCSPAEHESGGCCSEAVPQREEPDCCARLAPERSAEGRWVVGLFAQKCRGDGPLGLFQADLLAVPDTSPIQVRAPERVGRFATRAERAFRSPMTPPSPPPR